MATPGGPVKMVLSLLKPLWTKINELALGVQTEAQDAKQRPPTPGRPSWRGEVLAGAAHDDNFHYATIDYWNARRILRFLKPDREDVFYDIGSGKGRILCVFARKRLRRCVGVELSASLCETARQNAKNLRRKKTPIDVVCGDAATVDLSDGTIYFMFNPFGGETLRDTLENIKGSLQIRPRRLRILYYNSQYESVVEATGWLRRLTEFESLGGLRITLWENSSPVRKAATLKGFAIGAN